MSELKNKTIKGVFWSAAERFSIQGIQFVLGIILARLLMPSDYGIIGMLAIFMSISQVFVDSGFTNALIREKNRSEADFSTAFYTNASISLLFYVILFYAAPYIALFYHNELLISVTRVYCLVLIVNAFSAVNKVKLTVALDFKTMSKITISSALFSGLLGIALAYLGCGVWALVAQTLSWSIMDLFLSFYFVRWLPKHYFSKDSFSRLFGFGSKLLASSLIGSVYSNIFNLTIGHLYNAEKLGYYSRADNLAGFAGLNISNILQRVAFPVLSEVQDDDQVLLDAYKRYIVLSAYITFPIILGLLGIAKPFVLILLTEKWLPCVILLQILCFNYIWDCIIRINLNLLAVKGRSDLMLKLEVIKKSTGLSILLISVNWGVIGICIGQAMYSLIAFYMNTYYTKKLFHYGFISQVKEIIPSLLLASIIAVEGLIFSETVNNSLSAIIISMIICPLTYISLSVIFKLSPYLELQSFFLNYRK